MGVNKENTSHMVSRKCRCIRVWPGPGTNSKTALQPEALGQVTERSLRNPESQILKTKTENLDIRLKPKRQEWTSTTLSPDLKTLNLHIDRQTPSPTMGLEPCALSGQVWRV